MTLQTDPGQVQDGKLDSAQSVNAKLQPAMRWSGRISHKCVGNALTVFVLTGI